MVENASMYRSENMPETDGGRRVQTIDGTPSTILTRASEIEDLAEKMSRAARTLELFANGTVGRGASFEAIREQAKEVHGDLAVAADRYRPSGEALRTYAGALSSVQGSTDWRVAGAEREWPEVRAASQALLGAQQEVTEFDEAAENAPEGDEPAGSRPSSGAEQARFDSAVADWEAYWSGYDAPVETFESAYSAAADSLEGSNENGVKDGFWDDAMPFIEAMLVVLTVVGVILLVVAFFVTGPLALLAGLLSVVAGVLSLVGELGKMAAGRGDWGSVAFAAIGIIPFGKLAKLGDLAQFASAGSRFPRLSGALRLGGDEFVQYGAALDGFLAQRMPALFSGQHGLNSINLMRTIRTPEFLVSNFGRTGSIRAGWMALAGNPTNAAEAIGGSVDAYLDVLDSLKNVNDLLPSR